MKGANLMTESVTYTRNNWIFQELLMMLGHIVHSNLMRQIDYLKVENKILRSRITSQIRLSPCEKRRILKYGIALGKSARYFISVVSYSNFRRWVREAKPGYIKKPRQVGRKRTPQQIRDLVVRLAKENNWGYTRILGELKKLEIVSLSRNTIKNILKENGLDPVPERSKDVWGSYVKRHFKTLWACDFFTKTAWTMFGPKTIHALFFINVHTRKVHIAGITKNPTNEWVKNKAKTVSFLFHSEDNAHKLLLRDSDSKFPKGFDEIFNKQGFAVKKLPFRSPNLNPYAEGWVGTIKRECLNHFFVFGEKHFKYLVREYVKYYNTVRPHSAMNNMPLNYKIKYNSGKLKCDSRLGGLIRHYYRK